MIDAAYMFDDMSEDIIDQNMCTTHCPCYTSNIGLDPHIAANEAMIRYHSVNEPYLNLRNRTWSETSEGDNNYIPFTWTTDLEEGVTTFEQCFNKYF